MQPWLPRRRSPMRMSTRADLRRPLRCHTLDDSWRRSDVNDHRKQSSPKKYSLPFRDRQLSPNERSFRKSGRSPPRLNNSQLRIGSGSPVHSYRAYAGSHDVRERTMAVKKLELDRQYALRDSFIRRRQPRDIPSQNFEQSSRPFDDEVKRRPPPYRDSLRPPRSRSWSFDRQWSRESEYAHDVEYNSYMSHPDDYSCNSSSLRTYNQSMSRTLGKRKMSDTEYRTLPPRDSRQLTSASRYDPDVLPRSSVHDRNQPRNAEGFRCRVDEYGTQRNVDTFSDFDGRSSRVKKRETLSRYSQNETSQSEKYNDHPHGSSYSSEKIGKTDHRKRLRTTDTQHNVCSSKGGPQRDDRNSLSSFSRSSSNCGEETPISPISNVAHGNSAPFRKEPAANYLAQNLTLGTPFDLVTHLDAARSHLCREFDPDQVVVLQRSLNGSTPLSSRQEFLGVDLPTDNGGLSHPDTSGCVLLTGNSECDPCIRLGQHIAAGIDQHIALKKHPVSSVMSSYSEVQTANGQQPKLRQVVVRKSSAAVASSMTSSQKMSLWKRQPVIKSPSNPVSSWKRKPVIGQRSAVQNSFDLREKINLRRNRLQRFSTDGSSKSSANPDFHCDSEQSVYAEDDTRIPATGRRWVTLMP